MLLTFAEKRRYMGTSKHIRQVTQGKLRGRFIVVENGKAIQLNPTESTIFRFFLAHPEGVASKDIPLYREELSKLYAHESIFDESERRNDVLESLCSESKTVFYSNILRIKRKFVAALGARQASGYYIKRHSDGLYRTRALMIKSN